MSTDRTARAVPPPPQTSRRPVHEHWHGHDVVDPYRYLEDGSLPETQGFIREQNAYTRTVLDPLPEREELRQALTRFLAVGSLGVPVRRGDRLFYTRREAEQAQPVLFVCRTDGSDERVLYDPATDSDSGLVSLDWWHPSPDGSLVAYGTSHNGDEWSTLKVRDVETLQDRPDRAERARGASVAWLPDLSGFYYTRYPMPGTVAPGGEYFHQHVFFHEFGREGVDPEVFGEGHPAQEMMRVSISPDGRFVFVQAHRGWVANDLYVLDRNDATAGFVPVWQGQDATYAPVMGKDSVYVVTNDGAPHFRVLAARFSDLGAGASAFRVVVPEDAAVLAGLEVAKGHLVAVYGKDAVSEVRRFDLEGQPLGPVALPPLGSVVAISADRDADAAYVHFESFTQPDVIYRLDCADGAIARWRGIDAPAGADGIRVRQVFYRSKDGTRVPMFILTGPDAPSEGPPPQPAAAVLEGYGGFRIAREPAYLGRILPWVRRGGVYAIANLRGGSEYGEAWHRDGMMERKQNTFDDFISAAEFLVESGYTTPDRLGIYGASNGGLLVGACLTQRPDLFRAVRCAVPLLDMLRYHRFRLGALWTAEYGSPDDPGAYAWISAYSPYQQVRPGTRYPAVFLSTADSDSRVDPMHALKMTALLQHDGADLSERPVILWVEHNAGHGAGKPVHKVIDEYVDVFSFMAWQLGAEGRWR